jgi:hypothetical protein
MAHLGVPPDRNGAVDRLRCAAVGCVECMGPEVARQPISVTENIGMDAHEGGDRRSEIGQLVVTLGTEILERKNRWTGRRIIKAETLLNAPLFSPETGKYY